MTKAPLEQVREWSHRHWTIRVFWLRKMRRRYRWALRLCVVLPLVILSILIMVAHSPVTRFLVVRALEKELNLDVEADSVYVALDGDLVIDRAKFRIPGVPGPAGQFLNVARIEAAIDWWSTCAGSPKVRVVRMTEPVVIVSQSIDDSTLNLERFKPPPATGGEPTIPRIEITHAGIEIGEHSADQYRSLRRVQMDGWFRPSAVDLGGFAFGLHEYSLRPRRPGGPKEPGFVVTGTRAQGILTMKVENFTLDDWPASSVPSPSRKQFEAVDLKGDVPRAIFAYAPGTGITAKLVMLGVEMNLPIEPNDHFAAVAEGVQGPLPKYARMREVNGEITFTRDSILAQVEGKLEDLPYSVNLRYNGLTPESPFTCAFESKDFSVSKSPSLLPYAPPRVREWLGLFCGPTALITTKMTVKRDPPVNGVAAEPQVQGTLTLKEGTAAYARFPYEFRDMTGTFEFDNNKVKFDGVKGRSLSGATIEAHGLVTPLDESAEVTVDVAVRNAAIDSAMEDAFGPDRRQVLAALFSMPRYQELVAAGLVQTAAEALTVSEELALRTKELDGPNPAPTLRADIAALQRLVARPVFDFRGTADVDIHVHSPRGAGTVYQTKVDIRIPRAGLVPEKFPLPAEARDVTVRIDNEKGTLTGGTFRAIGGGTAQVQAAFHLPARNDPDIPPDITIAAQDLPFSALLIHALPGSDADSAIKRILRDLNIDALGKGTVHIAGRPGGSSIGFDADFTLADAGVAPAPPSGAGPIRVGAIAGRINACEDKLKVELTGNALVPDGAGGQVPAATGPVAATIHADFGRAADNTKTTYGIEVTCPGLNLAAPAETLVHAFSAKAASELMDLRRTYQPGGAADIKTAVTDQGSGLIVEVTANPASDLKLRMFDGDMALSSPQGEVFLRSAASMTVRCDDLRGDLKFAGQNVGAVRLSGSYPGPGAADPDQLHTLLKDLPIESELVRTILASKLSTEGYDIVQSLHPKGILDADLTVVPDLSSPQDRSLPSPRPISSLEPKWLEYRVGDVPVALKTMGGRVEIDGAMGVVHGLSANAASWSVTADGAWEVSVESGFTLRTQLSGKAEKLTPDLRASLPAGLRETFETIALKVEGPMSLEDATLALARTTDHSGDWTRFAGSLGFAGASMETGASIADLAGRLDATYQRDGEGVPQYRLIIDADSFRIGGVALGAGRALIHNGAAVGELLMPEASGECYGGRYAATARVFNDRRGGHSYEADTRLSGVRFSPLMGDLSASLKKESAPETAEEIARQRSDFSRGILDAEVSLGGTVGRSETRRGRGTLRIHGGRVMNIPFATRLVEVSNLALPANARLDFARAAYFMEGGLITFEDLSIYSSSVEILGYGTMTWPGQVLDLRFGSRSARPVPILSQLVQGIREQLLTTTVTGKLGEQQVRVEQLAGPRRMLGRAVGASESEQTRRLNEIERRIIPASPRADPKPIAPLPPVYGQTPNGS